MSTETDSRWLINKYVDGAAVFLRSVVGGRQRQLRSRQRRSASSEPSVTTKKYKSGVRVKSVARERCPMRRGGSKMRGKTRDGVMSGRRLKSYRVMRAAADACDDVCVFIRVVQ